MQCYWKYSTILHYINLISSARLSKLLINRKANNRTPVSELLSFRLDVCSEFREVLDNNCPFVRSGISLFTRLIFHQSL